LYGTEYRFIGAKEIAERYKQKQRQPQKKTGKENKRISQSIKLIIPLKDKFFYQQVNDKAQRNNCIVQAIFRERVIGGSEKFKPLAVQNKSGDVPRHDERTYSGSQDKHAVKAHFSKVFRREEKRNGAKLFCKVTGYRSKQDNPENKQHLVPSEMKQYQLYRKRIYQFINAPFHETDCCPNLR
jgi:hypothetical protein